MSGLKIMSCNLRVDVAADGINAFPNRRERLIAKILEEKPDIIGFQEANDAMRAYLAEHLTGYMLLGCGRKKEYRGEGIPVALRIGTVEVISFKTRWLSSAPDVPGSRYEESDQSSCPRMYHEVHLVTTKGGHELRFYNTHTDHKGAQAKLLEVTQLLAEIEVPADAAVVFTGDFNAKPHSEPIRYMMEGCPQRKIVDATAELGGTFHGFGKVENCKIDYIFTNLAFRDSYQISCPPVDGVYLSDHDPICTYVEFPEKEEM